MASAAFVVLAVVVHISTGGVSPYTVGRLFANVVFIPTIAVALIARGRPLRWRWWTYLVPTSALAVAMCGLTVVAGVKYQPAPSTTLDALPIERVKRDAHVVNAGILTDAESDCVVTAMTARSDLNVGQVVEYFRRPLPGPVETAYDQVLPKCLDPTAVVEPEPLHPLQRLSFVNAMKVEFPQFSAVESECFLDAAIANGATARKITLSAYDEALADELLPAFLSAVEDCDLSFEEDAPS